jgi:hypothetical protein
MSPDVRIALLVTRRAFNFLVDTLALMGYLPSSSEFLAVRALDFSPSGLARRKQGL